MGRRDESGAATAEAAMVIPMLVLVAVGLCWFVSLGVAQVRVVDAARETARALAREDDPDEAIERGRRVAPDGARITVVTDGDDIEVTVKARVSAPGGLFDFPGFAASATAVAAKEEVS